MTTRPVPLIHRPVVYLSFISPVWKVWASHGLFCYPSHSFTCHLHLDWKHHCHTHVNPLVEVLTDALIDFCETSDGFIRLLFLEWGKTITTLENLFKPLWPWGLVIMLKIMWMAREWPWIAELVITAAKSVLTCATVTIKCVSVRLHWYSHSI